MKLNEFIAKLKQTHDVPNYYNNHFPKNCGYYDGSRYSWDCWNLIKTILAMPPWEDTKVVGSYVQPKTFITGDIDGLTMLKKCSGRSKDFSKLKQPGTYLYIYKDPHAGIYLGDFTYQGQIFNVIECTGAWEGKVQYTYVDDKGGRYLYKNGPRNKYDWEEYGLLPWVDYSDAPIIQKSGIDVSRYQDVIDWANVKASGVEFAIIKAGGSDSGRYKDKYFETNYANAKAVGLKVGCYFIHGKGFMTAQAGIADAQYFVSLLSGKTFDYPCFSDLEIPTTQTRNGNTDAVIAFCDYVRNSGFQTGIYASDISGFKDRLDISRLDGYDKWVARYGSSPSYVTDYQIWQYSSSGSVPGIKGRVDMDISYKDYSNPTPAVYTLWGADFSPVFDPKYYAKNPATSGSPTPTLGDIFTTDGELWSHFVMFGMNEERQASAEFNEIAYRERYSDLQKAFGNNYPMYYYHYCVCGKAEGRSGLG